MINENEIMFYFIVGGLILFSIVFLIACSIRKVSKNQKENKPTNAFYIVLILYGILFFIKNELIISLSSIIVGIIGNIYNYKNKENKYFKLNIVIYSLMILYGLMFLGNIVFINTI